MPAVPISDIHGPTKLQQQSLPEDTPPPPPPKQRTSESLFIHSSASTARATCPWRLKAARYREPPRALRFEVRILPASSACIEQAEQAVVSATVDRQPVILRYSFPKSTRCMHIRWKAEMAFAVNSLVVCMSYAPGAFSKT